MDHPRASLGYSCCYLQENIEQTSPPGITLETADRLYAVSRGEQDVLQGNEKGIDLLQSALNLLFGVGNGTQVDAYWHGLMLVALSLDPTALGMVGSVGWAQLGAQFSVPGPGTLFPRFVSILAVEVCQEHPSMSLLLSQGGAFAPHQNILHREGSLWLLQQHNSNYKELHHAKINHILHWLMSLWKGMAS